jgi:hypothetical protein
MTDEKKQKSQADKYRQRSALLTKAEKSRTGAAKRHLGKTIKALDDMADNEDWLDGKPGSKLK